MKKRLVKLAVLPLAALFLFGCVTAGQQTNVQAEQEVDHHQRDPRQRVGAEHAPGDLPRGLPLGDRAQLGLGRLRGAHRYSIRGSTTA